MRAGRDGEAAAIKGMTMLGSRGRLSKNLRVGTRRRVLLAAPAVAVSSVLVARSWVAAAETTAVPGDSSQTTASRHYITFQAPINDTTSSRLIAILSGSIQKGVNDFHIIVSTGGGSISAALLIYGFLRSLPAKVTTYNLSTIQSAGEIIYLAGEIRKSNPNAIFMFHQAKQNFTGNPNLTLDDFTDWKTFLAMDLKRVDDIYRERTSLTAAQIEEFRQHVVYFDAVAALDAGIVHEIAPLSIPPRANITALNPSTTPAP
jgi:ATP-dependent protease ClpP protease subunit